MTELALGNFFVSLFSAGLLDPDQTPALLVKASVAEGRASHAISSIEGTVADRFHAEAKRWVKETDHLSSVRDICSHPSYRSIIQMGEGVLPYIFEELQNTQRHWFRALREITKVNPVPDAARGDVQAMTECWLLWAKENGLVRAG